MDAYENVLSLVESAVKEGLIAYAADPSKFEDGEGENGVWEEDGESSMGAIKRCKRPFWVCQPHVRPLPKEALEKGSLQLSKKAKRKLEEEAGLQKVTEGRVEVVDVKTTDVKEEGEQKERVEIPKEGVVCG